MLRTKEAISLNLNPDIVFSYLRMNRKLSQLIYMPISRTETFHSLLNLPGISWDYYFVKACDIDNITCMLIEGKNDMNRTIVF